MPKLFYTVPDKTHGDYVTEVVWDRYIRDNINNKIVPPLYIGTGPTRLNSPENSWVELPPNGALTDTDSMQPVPAYGEKWVTCRTAGLYIVTWQCPWLAGTLSTGVWNWIIRSAKMVRGETVPFSSLALADMISHLSSDQLAADPTTPQISQDRQCTGLVELAVGDGIGTGVYNGAKPATASGLSGVATQRTSAIWMGAYG